MKITKLEVELDSGDIIKFEQSANANVGCFSIEMEHPERIASDLLKRAETVAEFVFSSKF